MRHPNLADKGDACLVVVDMQQPFLNVMFDRETVVQNVRRLAEAAKILSLPMIATTQNAERMGNTVDEVQEVLGELIAIDKMSFSCCGSDEFNRAVANVNRRTVILCGIETHICMAQTALDLVHRGFKVHVPEDAVCSRTERNWRAGLEKMRQAGVIVTCTESVIYELLSRAGTDEFRRALKTVK